MKPPLAMVQQFEEITLDTAPNFATTVVLLQYLVLILQIACGGKLKPGNYQLKALLDLDR